MAKFTALPFIDKTAFEALPEAIRDQYDPIEPAKAKELTGDEALTYQLDVGDVAGYRLERPDALKSALSKERQEVSRLKAAFKEFEGVDPKKAREALKRIEDMKGWTPEEKVQQMIAEKEAALEAQYSGKLSEAEKRAQRFESEFDQRVHRDAVREAIKKHKGSETLLLDAILNRSAIKKSVGEDGRVSAQVFVKGPDGTPVLSKRMGEHGPMTVDELVGDVLKRDKEYQAAFEPDGGPGTGSHNTPPGGQRTSEAGGGGQGQFVITREQARDVNQYRAAKEQAAKLKQTLVIQSPD